MSSSTSSTAEGSAPDPERWLVAGRVGQPHGLDGTFRVTFAVPALLGAGGTVRIGGEERKVVHRGGHDGRVLLRIDGCVDRDGAQALRGSELRVPREMAPPLEEDEWWADELQGCRVCDGGRDVGTVREMLALPSCEVLVVDRTDGAASDLLVPLVSDAVRTVDVDAREIDIDLRFLGEE